MKTANLPSVRVTPELREAVEAVLKEGESLSSLLEDSVKAEVRRRVLEADFIARGLAARDEARDTGEYYSSAEVEAELAGILRSARKG